MNRILINWYTVFVFLSPENKYPPTPASLKVLYNIWPIYYNVDKRNILYEWRHTGVNLIFKKSCLFLEFFENWIYIPQIVYSFGGCVSLKSNLVLNVYNCNFFYLFWIKQHDNSYNGPSICTLRYFLTVSLTSTIV